MAELKIPDKYEVLFKIPEARLVMEGKSNAIPLVEAQKLAKVDIIVLTGGRNSGKSFTGNLALAYWCENYNYRILSTRYTLSSAEDTIIPDFMEKVDILGYRKFFKIRRDRIVHRVKKAKVVFKGIKTGSGNQTANLKSLKDFNVFSMDEAEEMDNYNDWQKIRLSMRAHDVQNMSMIMMNPTDEDCWQFKRFFEERGVNPGFCGIHGNILYIHTTYLDLDPDLIQDTIRAEFERLKKEDPEEYDCVVLGKWRKNVKGAVFKRHEVNYYQLLNIADSIPVKKIGFIDVADEGDDSLSFPIGYLIGDFIYIVDWYFSKENTDITIPDCAELCRIYELDYIGVETNGMGAIFSKEITKVLPARTEVMLINQSSKAGKHSRILQAAGSVKRTVIFRDDISVGGMYHLAMVEFFKYNRDKSLNKNDDSPDSITGLKLLCDDLSEY